ncbi:uncharacterized protein LOC134184551 isoform X2 [Corticium candelabrum]|uniref:uncharacterized protein LOC134184551 isoform X2 n=1 Tax=Corticium candelabrum TaxID=121492 RepID=UPI002E325FA5|nr:uncharacterized protein LOC134184551 isoform X2 [Corticium candelabrum]
METWLEQSVLSECYKPLSDAGINILEIAARLTKEDLKMAKIEQSDIVERLLTACSSLKFGKLSMDVEKVDGKTDGGQHVPTASFTANCDYQATDDSELTIKKGDLVVVLDKSDKDRWKGVPAVHSRFQMRQLQRNQLLSINQQEQLHQVLQRYQHCVKLQREGQSRSSHHFITPYRGTECA